MVAAAGSWFDRRQSLAIGVAVSGIGVGTLVGAPIAAKLIGSYGWRATYVIFAAATIVVLGVCAAVTERPRSMRPASLSLGRAIRTGEFGILYLTTLLVGFGLFTFFVHLVPYAQANGAGPVAAAALLGIVGAFSTLGRLLFGPLADRFGRIRMLQVSVFCMAGSFLIWVLGPNYAGLATFAAITGAAYGGWVAISPSVLAELFGSEGLGGTAGLMYTAAGVGALLGPPLAGWIVDSTGGYRPAIVAAMVLEVAAFAVILTLRPKSRHVPA
jgi:MFS family permease